MPNLDENLAFAPATELRDVDRRQGDYIYRTHGVVTYLGSKH